MKTIGYYIKRLSFKSVFLYVKDKLTPLKDLIIEKKIQSRFNKLYKKGIIRKGIEDSPRKLIISLTSYPKRFDKLHLVIYQLLNQTVKPNKVILVLSKKEVKDESEIPKKILFLKKLGLEIKFVKENYRSYNKLIFTLKDYPQYNHITVDDDVLYPRWLLKGLYAKHMQYPKDIISYRAHLMKKSNDKILPYIEWMTYDIKKFYSGLNMIPTGVCGILYPPNSLNPSVFNSNIFLKISPIQDDVWFKAMSLLYKTNCRRVFMYKNPQFPLLSSTQKSGLNHQNVDLGKNDEQIEKVFKKYNLNKYLYEISQR